MNPVPKSEIGDTEVEMFSPRAVYVFGLPATPITSTINHLLKWHLPVVFFFIVMSVITLVLLRNLVLLVLCRSNSIHRETVSGSTAEIVRIGKEEKVKIDVITSIASRIKMLCRISDFNEAIRSMKANRSFLWFFVLQLILSESMLAGLIYINRSSLEDVVSDFTSVSDEVMSAVIAHTSWLHSR
jgi:hypothetical protein